MSAPRFDQGKQQQMNILRKILTELKQNQTFRGDIYKNIL